jgi:two-component system, cell cycle sensor histidine kinase and response regulator CckA
MERPDVGPWSAKDVARLLALLQAQLGYYREIAAALPMPVALVSDDRSLIWTNRAFRKRFGTKLPDRGFTEIPLRAWHDEDEIETLLVFGQPPQEIPARGEETSSNIPGITPRHQLERQLLAAGRFEALYGFAGRLAHDLNNPLMIVTGYAEELMQALKPNDPLRQEASEILGAARRIGGIAAQLTEFARPQGKAASRINVGDTILSLRSKLTAAAGAAGEHIAVELSASRTPVLAMADPGQLGEVLAALVARPSRGIPRERKRIAIAWDVETVAERLSPAPLVPGKYARITVHEEGPEMDAAHAAGIFEPILSKTGDPAPGAASSGLALARAYSIVHQWGGDIAFSSEPGQGSTFAIYLAYVEPEKEPEGSPAKQTETQPGRKPATILVVDDEIGIRELIRKILLRERYRVLEAGSAEEALRLSQETTGQGQSIDLLISDVMLPGIHGPELARRMQETASGLKTLFISGFTGEEKVPAGARFLAKPFTLVALIEKVREALETN